MTFRPVDPDGTLDRGGLGPQPPPIACSCGRIATWAIWPPTGHRAHGSRPPRWCRPSVDPCEACEVAWSERQAERRLEGRQRSIGLGDRDRGWRWTSARVQHQGQTTAEFMSQVRAGQAQTIGVLRSNQEAARAIAAWTPDCGHSLYLAGMTGSGKTVMAAALATRLLGGLPQKRVQLTEEEGRERWGLHWPRIKACGRDWVVRQAVAWRVAFCPDSDLYERERQSWQKDRTPLARVVDADALILDDLGESGSDPLAGVRMPPGYVDMIQRLIRRRYSQGRHLVITSNVPMRPVPGRLSGVAEWFGDRVHSRLIEMTQGHVYALESVDWRRP